MEGVESIRKGGRFERRRLCEAISKEAQKKMRQKKRLIDILILIVIFCCVVFLCITPYEDWKAGREKQRMIELARRNQVVETVIETEEVSGMEGAGNGGAGSGKYLSPINFEALRRVNPDVVAWLVIPGTSIDYPVVQTTDNEIYLNKTFEGRTSASGAIFLDCDSRMGPAGFHSIFYGHHMRNKTMFTDLIKFKEEEFFKEHREIILYTPEKELHLETVAALYGDAGGENRRTNFSSQEKFNEYAAAQTMGCSYRELPEGNIRHLYSFVTCSYEFDDARTTLYAVEREN